MDPLTLSILGGSLVSGLGSLLNDSASKRAAITRGQASLTKSALEENLRRTEGQQAQAVGSTVAGAGATGFAATSSSFTSYLTSMAEQFQKQNAFTRMQDMARVDLLNQAATAEDDNPMAKLLGFGSAAAGGLTSAYKSTNGNPFPKLKDRAVGLTYKNGINIGTE